MASWLTSFIMRDTGRFLLLAAALIGVVFVLLRLWSPSSLQKLERLAASRGCWLPISLLVLSGYLVLLLLNTTYPGYLEHIEPNIASVSYLLAKGAPLYHDVSSAQRYSFPYGPMAYLPYAWALQAFGATVGSLKFVVLLANVALLALMFGAYAKILDRAGAVLVTAVVAVFFLYYDYLFQVRGDVLVVFLVALGLYAVLRLPAKMAALLLAMACAAAVDIKITAVLYFVPLLVLLCEQVGWQVTALVVVTVSGLALLPFLSPSISLVAYFDWLRLMSRQSLSSMEFVREVKLLSLVLAPLALLLWNLGRKSTACLSSYLRRNYHFVLALAVSIAAIGISSCKLGAGPHHFMPFYPLLGYLGADIFHVSTMIAGARQPVAWNISPLLWTWLGMAIAVLALIPSINLFATLFGSRQHMATVANDLRYVMQTYAGDAIEMGYGGWNERYRLTYSRPALVFAGNPLTVDAVALGDMQFAGVTIPPSTLEYLDQCRTRIWLVPKGDLPFAMVNVYSLMDPQHFPKREVFSDDFRDIFFRRYTKQGSSRYFDIWKCTTGAPNSLPQTAASQPLHQ
ncbi:MAG: hypothetical protein WB555_19405 [Candidatus Korobacteraceae bacterium]